MSTVEERAWSIWSGIMSRPLEFEQFFNKVSEHYEELRQHLADNPEPHKRWLTEEDIAARPSIQSLGHAVAMHLAGIIALDEKTRHQRTLDSELLPKMMAQMDSFLGREGRTLN